MKELKVGLIGLGFMGTTHFRIYQSLPGVKIAAIADVDPDKRRGDISKVVGNIGGSDNSVPFDLSGMEVYDNALDLINKSDVDIVDICVPTPFHAEYLTAALDAGKHVFSEKPLCRNLSEIAKIHETVKELSTVLRHIERKGAFSRQAVINTRGYLDALLNKHGVAK